MLLFKIDLTGIRALDGSFRSATADLVRRQRAVVEEAATLGLQSLKRHCPVGQHWTPEGRPFTTAELQKSIRISRRAMKPTASPEAKGAYWGMELDISMASYGRYTVAGVPAHPIFPRTGRCLHFFWAGIPASAQERLRRTIRNVSGAGAEVWLAHVYHPGYPGRPWHLEAYIDVEPQVEELLRSVGKDFARDVLAYQLAG